MGIEIIEDKVLIALRQPPGDRWKLVDEPEGKMHTSITDTLEAYMHKTGFKGHYRLEPLSSKLYAIKSEEIEIKPEPIKTYSLYGEYSEPGQ
jgi:hypothetical protein|tara:strand:+ start:2577 stop:2852 length:276 start_codon:yes stop_codon:yes gene_type:complete